MSFISKFNYHDMPSDKEVSFREMVVQQLNYWRSMLIDRTAAFHASAKWRSELPGTMVWTQNSQSTGRPESIASILTSRANPLAEARYYVAALENLLAAVDGSGDLLSSWSQETIDQVLTKSTEMDFDSRESVEGKDIAIDPKDLDDDQQ